MRQSILWHDVRHALRALRRTPAFTLATLAVGIDAGGPRCAKARPQ